MRGKREKSTKLEREGAWYERSEVTREGKKEMTRGGRAKEKDVHLDFGKCS